MTRILDKVAETNLSYMLLNQIAQDGVDQDSSNNFAAANPA